MGSTVELKGSEIARHRTAMKRYTLSRPLSLAISHGIVGPSYTVFDFGCGHGADVRLLQRSGVCASGWDPHFHPKAEIIPADCVNLGYVLNVIEDPAERLSTLMRAFELARLLLIVSVRVDQSLTAVEEFSDGYLTRHGAFQKLFTQEEFKEYLQNALGLRPHMASLGIAYIFKDAEAESKYLANLSIFRPRSFRTEVIAEFSKDRVAQRYVALTKKLGRVPIESEFPSFAKLIDRFGPPQRIERIIAGIVDNSVLEVVREKTRERILTYLGMMRLQGMKAPPIRMLPPEVQADIKMLWTNYKAADEAGTAFLFRLGKPELIKEACLRAPIGKKLPEDFYVHKSAEGQLPALLSLLIFAARQVVGELDYDLVKIATEGRKVSFMRYANFEEEAHPRLLHSVRVYLPTSSYSIRDYSTSVNPPILHRKDAFVDPWHPRYIEFSNLTQTEERLGLLSRSDIGTRNGWLSLLKERRLRIVGHTIVEDAQETPHSDSDPVAIESA
jgi:DNA phosphorothioation-associated putative methyltransferase